MKRSSLAVVVAILLASVLLAAQAPSMLDRVLPPGEVFCEMNAACAWFALAKAGVPAGLEDPTPLRDTHPTFRYGGLTVRELLTMAVEAEPQFEWREMNGVVVLRTHAAWNDRDNLLNQPVRSPYVLSDVDMMTAMFLVTGHDAAPRPPTGKLFSLRIENATVLDVLNKLALTNGEGWRVFRLSAPIKGQHLMFSKDTGPYGSAPFVERVSGQK